MKRRSFLGLLGGGLGVSLIGFPLSKGAGVKQNIPKQPAQTYSSVGYGRGFKISDNTNKYKLWSKWSKELGKVMRKDRDRMMNEIIAQAWR